MGKGTIVDALVRRDPGLWLSRSWTTRERRRGEAHDAYVFVSSEAFEKHITDGGFLEWTEFLGNYYGTPRPDLLDGDADIVLEIELDGAQQVKRQYPEAILICPRLVRNRNDGSVVEATRATRCRPDCARPRSKSPSVVNRPTSSSSTTTSTGPSTR